MRLTFDLTQNLVLLHFQRYQSLPDGVLRQKAFYSAERIQTIRKRETFEESILTRAEQSWNDVLTQHPAELADCTRTAISDSCYKGQRGCDRLPIPAPPHVGNKCCGTFWWTSRDKMFHSNKLANVRGNVLNLASSEVFTRKHRAVGGCFCNRTHKSLSLDLPTCTLCNKLTLSN